MRKYPLNSPHAAARIVALTMWADGELSQTELDTLQRLGAHTRLGLSTEELQAVTQSLCVDLLSATHCAPTDACIVDPRTLAELMAEVDDPELRAKVLRLCVAIVEADAHIAEGESIVMVAAVEHWGMHHAMLAPGPATAE